MALLQSIGKPVIVMGDLNARTAGRNAGSIERFSEDRTITARSRKLLHTIDILCYNILNGQHKYGASNYTYTSHQPNGKSVIDYAIINQQADEHIVSFDVAPLMEDLSDHTALVLNVQNMGAKQSSEELAIEGSNAEILHENETSTVMEAKPIDIYTPLSQSEVRKITGTIGRDKDTLNVVPTEKTNSHNDHSKHTESEWLEDMGLKNHRSRKVTAMRQLENRRKLLETKSEAGFWKELKRLTSSPLKPSEVTADQLRMNFEKRMNPLSPMPPAFDSGRLQMNRSMERLIPDITVDKTEGQYFSKPFAISEIEEAKSLMINKNTSPGLDKITYKDIEQIPNEQLCTLMNECIQSQQTPTTWLTTVLIGIIKKGKPKSEAESFRAIGLENLSNAFPSTDQGTLWLKMRQFGASGKIYDWLRRLYKEMTYCVRHGDEFSDLFQSTIGILIGDTASPTLWNIYLADFKTDNDVHDIILDDIALSHLEQADDIMFLSTTEHGLQTKMNALWRWCGVNFMVINAVKSSVMVLCGKTNNHYNFTFGDTPVEVSHNQSYVGMTITPPANRGKAPNIFEKHYDTKTSKASKVANTLLGTESMVGVLSPIEGKKMYIALVDPHLVHGCEISLDTNKANLQSLEKVQIEFLRRLLGVNK
ncbi:hypothetical protein CVT24_013418 [Panaeolus cyanescens]|uniref:Reverse transcriptase domain-containing protein n=1 Tax=Panaeolus cyanescens TaxID=181874 RepID=A0A409YMP0_9AGAR|nr:hypothetical protein CVT24_013418 [Panaeolus cyanescens]